MFQNGWVFWVIIGVTVLQWVFGKLREQAEMNRAKQDREKQRIDSLRTGQGLNTGASTVSRSAPTISQHDLQARRQAQLKALRDRQRALGQTGASPAPAPSGPTMGPAPRTSPARPSRVSAQTARQTASFPATSSKPVPQQRLLPSPQTARQTTVAAQRAARARQIRINRQRQLQEQRQQKAQSQPSQSPTPVETRIGQPKTSRIEKPKHSRISAPKHSRISAPKQSRIMQRLSLERDEVQMTTASKASASQAASSLRPVSRQDWRRAIIASEIFAPPVSMREMD